MAWTSLSFAYGSVLTSTKMTQMYDNFAYGAGSTNPTFLAPALGTPASGDLTNCTSNTEAVGTNNTQLATTAFCEAGFVNNDVYSNGVGTFEFCYKISGTLANDATALGSDLYGVAFNGAGGAGLASSSAVLTGTWRNISGITMGSYAAGPAVLCQRIA